MGHGQGKTKHSPMMDSPMKHSPMMGSPMMHEPVMEAVCILDPTEGNTASGKVTFTRVKNGIRVEGKVTGLTPGKHGFHVHEYGDLSKADGTSLGGHFNPTHQPHSGPDMSSRHIGDLGNIVANAEGVAEFDFVDPLMRFMGPESILGRGLVVHAGEDDLESQPTGAAGARVAVGVIGVASNASE